MKFAILVRPEDQSCSFDCWRPVKIRAHYQSYGKFCSVWAMCNWNFVAVLWPVPVAEKRLMDVKLGELGSWFGGRDFTPNGIISAIRRGEQTCSNWNFIQDPKKSSLSSYLFRSDSGSSASVSSTKQEWSFQFSTFKKFVAPKTFFFFYFSGTKSVSAAQFTRNHIIEKSFHKNLSYNQKSLFNTKYSGNI